MKDLVKYLAEFESTAGNLYAEAAEYFRDDPTLSSFLRDLEQDEIFHYDMMNRIADAISDNLDGFHVEVLIDRKSREQLDTAVVKLRERMSGGTLDETGLFKYVVDIEYSEWNDIFVYIMDTMKDLGPDFQHAASQIELHKRKILRYMEERPNLGHLGSLLKEIRRVWDERVLIIDDEPALLKLFTAFLSKRYEVDTALDGEDGLRKILNQYYDVIISDVILPGLNGIEVYREAAMRDHDIAKRFLFFTGNLSPEFKAFFEKQDIEYLFKPVSLDVVEGKIRMMLDREETNPAA
jgi:CheY-like chemotaxis protein